MSVLMPSFAIGALAAAAVALNPPRKKIQAKKDKNLREHLSEKQIDRMVQDSFPASDPPSTY